MNPLSIVAVTLAAGRASRFGGDKLAADLAGRTVLDASLAVLDRFRFQQRAVVLDAERASGFRRMDVQVIVNPAPDLGMGHSLALAAEHASGAGARAMLVTLGDMPFLSPATVERLLAACDDRDDALAAVRLAAGRPGPPAIFGRSWFKVLSEGEGDSGARAILRNPANGAAILPMSGEEALDIDTPADLEAARKIIPSPR